MGRVKIVNGVARPLDRLAGLYGSAEMERVGQAVEHLKSRLGDGVVWNVNSTAHGGGVAELLHSLVPYARGAGVDSRWAVISGPPEFFVLTKRLHNALHGYGDAAGFSSADRELYEETTRENAIDLFACMRAGDVAILHDPQTAGLAPLLARHGVHVIWRCHIGSEGPNKAAHDALRFLVPYLESAASNVFSRAAYVPDTPALKHTCVIEPTIDPFSPKNREIAPEVCRAILVRAGLIEGPPPAGVAPEFQREDGSISHVSRGADVIRLGRTCCAGMPLVVQISRWDRLKDHLGVMNGFANYMKRGGEARLMLVGPNVNAVADDPEGAQVFQEVWAGYHELPHAIRAHVELVNLPMADANENAAMVNALQRQATVLVQKSLQEGFGLTVTEAMWKGKPVIASRVGGIQDQIEDGVSGLLLDYPRDLQAFAKLLERVLGDPALAAGLGERAQQRVKDHFLSLRSLYDYADLVAEVIDRARATP